MNSNDSLVMAEFDNGAGALYPHVQIEHALADIKDTFQTPMIAKIPFNEIAALGGAFSGVVEKLVTPVGEGLYRCTFPKGVTGTLARAKDGSGMLGTILNKKGIAGQARWTPVDQAIGPAVFKAALIAVAVLAVVKQIDDIKSGQKEIIDILERDKKSQLLADYDILSTYMEEYQFYWDNDATTMVNLNQVKNIKRNAQKDIRSYAEQIEELVSAKRNLLKLQSASQKIGKLLDRFVHYKLALHVYALSEYLEVMLSKNFHAEYLSKASAGIRTNAISFLDLYSKCYDKIEQLKKEALTTQAVNRVAGASKTIGTLIGKIPVVKEGPVDEFLIGLGDTINESEKKQIEKTLAFFIQYKESGIVPIAEHIDSINTLANKPIIAVYDKNVLCFQELQDVC